MYVHDTAGNGIHLVLSRNVIINDCRVDNAGKKGINSNLSGHAIILDSVDGARITNNQINGFFGDGGILLFGMSLMRNAIVDHNTITGAHTDGGFGIGV